MDIPTSEEKVRGLGMDESDIEKIKVEMSDRLNELANVMSKNVDRTYDTFDNITGALAEITEILRIIVGVLKPALKDVKKTKKDAKKTKELQDDLTQKFDSTFGSLNEVLEKLKKNIDDTKRGGIYG